MSTYIRLDDKTLPEYDDICPELTGFLKKLVVGRGLSLKTANIYYVKIREYLKYLIITDMKIPESKFDETEIQIKGINPDLIRNATRKTVSDYIYFISGRGNSIKTRKDKLTAVRSFYNYLVSDEGYPDNPAIFVEMPKTPGREPKYLTPEDARRLLNASFSQETPERDYCITLMFLMTGMRLSELCALNTDSFDKDNDTFSIIGKGNKERTGYVNKPCKEAIRDWLDIRAGYGIDRDEKALFVSKRTKKRLTGRAVEKIIEKELAAAGLSGKGYSVHKLRHSAATFMYDNGADVLELKEILGHKNTSTTEIYTHLNNKRLKDVSKSIEDIVR